MDYEVPHQRKSKNDKRAKARYNRYKRGGSFRVQDKSDKNEKKEN
jgi:hypothetical protein